MNSYEILKTLLQKYTTTTYKVPLVRHMHPQHLQTYSNMQVVVSLPYVLLESQENASRQTAFRHKAFLFVKSLLLC